MMLRPRVLFSLLSFLALPLLGQSEVSEFPVSERDLAPMLGHATNVQVVPTDSGFLAFWNDGVARIARLSRDGTVERRVTVPELASNFAWYDAASNGETALLSGVCAGVGKPLCVARFSSAGDFLGLISIPTVSDPIAPVVASNGDDFLVTLSTNASREVVAVRVASDGTAGSPIILGPWDMNSQWTSVTAIGSQYFAGFGSPGEHRLVRLSQSGIEASVVLDPALSFWHQLRIEGSVDRLVVVIPGFDFATFATFDAQLAQQHPWTTILGAAGYPKLAPTAHGWLLATRDGHGAMIHPIARDGGVGTPAREAEAYDLYDLAARSDRALLVWTKRFELRTSVRATLFDDRAGILKTVTTLSVGPAPQIQPAAAEGSGVVLAAWSELGSDGRFAIRARASGTDGIPLAPPVTMPAGAESQFMPSVSFDGDSFLVVWSEWETGVSAVNGARVSTTGRLLDDSAISLFGSGSPGMGNIRSADVTWSGTAWIVVSSDDRSRIVARRVSPAGVVLDFTPTEITRLSSGAAGNFAPRIECNGSECLVAWHGPGTTPNCYRTACVFPVAVWARRISPDLIPLDPSAAELTIPHEEIPDPRRTSVAWNEIADSWLVAWSFDGRRRVARGGGLLDPAANARYYGGVSISAIPEREGWRLAWSSGGDVFHGWSRTGRAADVEERFALTALPEPETDAQLVGGSRPLAFFVRESRRGASEVIGRFLDASASVATTKLELSVTRISDTQVRLSWNGNVEGVTGFRIYRWKGAWQEMRSAGASESSVIVDLAQGRGAKFLLRAETQSGPVESNVVEIEGDRGRTATR